MGTQKSDRGEDEASLHQQQAMLRLALMRKKEIGVEKWMVYHKKTARLVVPLVRLSTRNA